MSSTKLVLKKKMCSAIGLQMSWIESLWQPTEAILAGNTTFYNAVILGNKYAIEFTDLNTIKSYCRV